MVHLLVLIAVALPTYLLRFEVAGIPSTLLEVLIYLVTVVGVVQLIQDQSAQERLYSRRVWLLPAGLIVLGAVLGAMIAPDTRVALGLLKGFIVDPLCIYLLLLAFLRTRDEAVLVARGAFFGSVAVALWSVVDAVSLTTSRAIGPYAFDADASPNYLAFATAPLLPLVVWLSQGKGKLWYWLGGLALVAALVASQSRAGLVAGVSGLVLAWILQLNWLWKERLARWGVVVGLILALGLSWMAVRPNFSLSSQEGGRITSSNNVRWQLWSATGELVRSHWLLGTGLGNFQSTFTTLTAGRVNYPEFIAPKARTPHNLLVGMWMETGLTGLVGMIGVLVLVGTSLLRAVRLQVDRGMAAALLGSWFVLLAHGLVDQPIWKNDTMVLFWLLVALPAVLKPVQKR